MKNYKFFPSDKLKTLLDDAVIKDSRTEQFIRAILLDRYKRAQQICTLSIAHVNENGDVDSDSEYDAERHFSHGGCDCCSHGLGNDVYPTIGYRPKTKSVLEVGEICHECICVEYNGID